MENHDPHTIECDDKVEQIDLEYIRSIFYSASPENRYVSTKSYYEALLHAKIIGIRQFEEVMSYVIELLKKGN